VRFFIRTGLAAGVVVVVLALASLSWRLRHNEMKLPVSFRVDPEEGGSRLTTETRIMFADRNLCHDYFWYWGIIYPGRSLFRIGFLEAVKHRAEAVLLPDARGKYLDTALDGGMA
jgi:hypothetical protein